MGKSEWCVYSVSFKCILIFDITLAFLSRIWLGGGGANMIDVLNFKHLLYWLFVKVHFKVYSASLSAVWLKAVGFTV